MYRTIHEVRAANEELGHHFFEPATMRFFRSRLCGNVIGGRFFVTSEQFEGSSGYRAPRRYTIREALPTGEIETVGKFQAWENARQAKATAQSLADMGWSA